MLVTRANRRARCACGACGGIVAQAGEAKPFATDPAEAIDFLRRKLNVPTLALDGSVATAALGRVHRRGRAKQGARCRLPRCGQRRDRGRPHARRLPQGLRPHRRGSRLELQRLAQLALARDLRDQPAHRLRGRASGSKSSASRRAVRICATSPSTRRHTDDTRTEHASWHDTVLPADDPWWQTHFPPNGWNCRCTVQSLNDRDLDRYGLAVADKAPPIEMVERIINTPDGPRTVLVPEGHRSGLRLPARRGASLGHKRSDALALTGLQCRTEREAPKGTRGRHGRNSSSVECRGFARDAWHRFPTRDYHASRAAHGHE